MGSSGINARVHGESNSLSFYPLDMKCFALISLVGVALGAPAPEDAAAPVVLPYGYGLGAYPYALPYAGLPLAYNALHTGLVYPVAEPYVHDAAGDVAVDGSPEAEAYVHDTTGDARKKREADAQLLLPAAYPYALPYAYHPLSSGLVYPVAETYVHDASGDVAEEYVHAPAGDARKKREADAQVLLAGAYPYAYGYAGLPYALPVVAPFVAHPNGAVVPLEPKDVVDARADHLKAVAEALKA